MQSLGRLISAPVGRLARFWRRSLHFRVVAITTIVGALFTLAIGSYMYQRIADGLVTNAINSAQQEAQSQRQIAQNTFSNGDRTDLTSLRVAARQIAQQVASPGSDTSRRVVIIQAEGNTAVSLGDVSTQGADPEMIPADIRLALKDDPDHEQVKIITVPDDDGRNTIPAVLIGSRLEVPNAGAYDLYFIFPMDVEAQTLAIVRNTFAFGGIALVLALAALAYLVTRMVVAPVRSAAHVAERLSAGALNERMPSGGEDDLARLATSFNAMADSLQRQIRQLEDLSTLQQRFTSDVSHELRTPLTTIRMAVDMIHASRDDFTAPVARSAELLSRELDRFEGLLTDLLEISRFDAGAAAMQLEPADLRDIAASAVDASSALAARAHTSLQLQARRPAVAPMDKRRIERIVRNLVSNAIEHAEGRPIEVAVAANETAVALTVRDHGVGLAPGDAARVFNRFWRADPARARTTGGTGLGLAISLEDARMHDGWLQAWGEPGNGSCFRLTLPTRAGVPIARSPLPLAPDDSEVGRVMPPGNSLTIGSALVSGSAPRGEGGDQS